VGLELRPAVDAMEAPRNQTGFSLLEVLFTSVVVLAMAISTVPMFTRGLVSNSAGAASTQVANAARGELERLLELPFASEELTLESGSARATSEYYSAISRSWRPYPLPAGNAGVLWTRVTTVRQYGVSAIADGELDTAEALAADTDLQFVHMKEIEVQVTQVGSVFGGPAKRIALRTLKVK
jgi:hypothetical protein